MSEAMWLTWWRMLHALHRHLSDTQSSCSSERPRTSARTRLATWPHVGNRVIAGVLSGGVVDAIGGCLMSFGGVAGAVS